MELNIHFLKKALQFYGLQPGENKLDPSGYVEYTDSEGKTTTWIKEDNLKDDKIESLLSARS